MKKLILWCLVLALLSVPALAEAADFTFRPDSGMITRYSGAGGRVTIPAEIDGAPVFGLDVQLFIRNKEITALEIPEPVAMLETSAIAGMSALTEVALPETLQYIGMSNFTDCNALTGLVIPPRVLFIGQDCFLWMDALESITFTGPAPYISPQAFRNLPDGLIFYVPDDQVESYTAALPEDANIQPSGENAVAVDESTPEDEFEFDPETGTVTGWNGDSPRVTIPAEIGGVAVKAIGTRAFYDQDSLFRVVIPDGVEIIGEKAFDGCDRLTDVVCPDSVREISASAFAYKYRGERFPWPASLRTIGDSAFVATKLKGDLILPEGLETIGTDAFKNAWVKKLYLPASLKSIGPGAFARTSLSTIEFGTTDFEMGEDAFGGIYPREVILPWDTDEATAQTFRDRFTAMYEECVVELAERPEAAIDDATLERFGGMWYLNTVTQDGTTISAADVGMEATLELSADGTAIMTMDDAEAGTWTVDGDTLTVSTGEMDDAVFTESDGRLTLEADGVAMTFGREPAQPGFIPGNPIEAQDIADFNGTWECRYGSVYDMTVPVDMFGDTLAEMLGLESLTFEIRDGDVRVAGTEAIDAFDFADGALSTQIWPPRTLTLLEDGMMACALEDGTLYLEKTDDETTLPKPTAVSKPKPAAIPKPTMFASSKQPVTPEPTLTSTPEPSVTPEPTPVASPEPEPMMMAIPVTEADFEAFGGEWHMVEIGMNGSIMNPSDIGISMTLTLNADGTAVVDTGDSVTGAVWYCEDDSLFLVSESSGTLELLPADGDLVIEADGQSMRLAKEDAAATQLPAAVPASDIADFNGTWITVSAQVYDMILPMTEETMSDELRSFFAMETNEIVIRDGEVNLFGSPRDFDFIDGRLCIQRERTEGAEPGSLDERIELREDGTLSYSVFGGMTIFCQRSEVEPEPEPATAAAFPELNVKYVCTKAMVGGHDVDVSALGGEYAVTFRGNGTADLVLAGTHLRRLDWESDGSAAIVNYLNAGSLRFEQEDDAVTLCFSDALNLTFTAK